LKSFIKKRRNSMARFGDHRIEHLESPSSPGGPPHHDFCCDLNAVRYAKSVSDLADANLLGGERVLRMCPEGGNSGGGTTDSGQHQPIDPSWDASDALRAVDRDIAAINTGYRDAAARDAAARDARDAAARAVISARDARADNADK
jgi:hypothetical protein